MIEIIWDEPLIRTLKKWKRKHPELIRRLEDRLNLFVENPFNPLLKTHNLGSFAIPGAFKYNTIN
jgi:mRNA-degrading endonuclease YafQ of YafQ-DinJ toxin-antitoxin module